MEVTITKEMILERIKKYYETTGNIGRLKDLNMILEGIEEYFLFIDNLLDSIVILDKEDLHYSKSFDNGKIINIEGKFILPFTIQCLIKDDKNSIISVSEKKS